jgi:hypothetical protein
MNDAREGDGVSRACSLAENISTAGHFYTTRWVGYKHSVGRAGRQVQCRADGCREGRTALRSTCGALTIITLMNKEVQGGRLVWSEADRPTTRIHF